MMTGNNNNECVHSGDEPTQNTTTLSPINSPRKTLSKSPKKQRMKLLEMHELSAAAKKKESKFALKEIPIIIKHQNQTSRHDIYGTEINNRNKRKVKVTFKDKINIENNDNKLVEYVDIESFKSLNKIIIVGDFKDSIVKDSCNCTCSIF